MYPHRSASEAHHKPQNIAATEKKSRQTCYFIILLVIESSPAAAHRLDSPNVALTSYQVQPTIT